jgi:N-acetylmuramoyl-L-alanine amidase
LALFCIGWCTVLGAAQLRAISLTNQPDRTTLYFIIDGAFSHKLFFLANPNRLVVDLSQTQLAMSIDQRRLSNALIAQIRTGHPSPNTLRLVFDVNRRVVFKSSPWMEKGGQKGIKVDVIAFGKVQALDAPQATAKAPPKQAPIHVKHSPAKGFRDVLVVLDAGHGGKDPGARGPRHSREKDVVLAIALKLKRLIDREPGMRAVLTRSGNYYVGLRERLQIARRHNGDVFVSIHADAFNNPHSNGASVFALSQSGATSEAARWIAEKENYSELGGVNLGDLDDQNGVVRSVLIDLSQTSTINSSLQMGGRVLSQLNQFTRLHNNKVEQARFMVLKSPDIPSILVETGFISNPREERNLTNAAYQNRISQAIFQGIKGYFWESPPQGTRIEAMVSKGARRRWG